MEIVKMILALRSGIRLKVIFLLYNWWNERNSVREGEKRRQAAHIAGLSWKQAMEIENLHKPMQQESGVRRRMRKWQRPQAGKLKINVDGAFRELDKNGGWGYVIRDEDGRVIHSGSGRQRYACNAMQMELRACIEGVKAARELGIGEIILETDAALVVEALLHNAFSLSMVGGVVHELKELLAENVISTQVKYVPRECNRVAHDLASIGSVSNEGIPSVLARVPDYIMFMVSNDSADMVE
jgi:ribonuclease HI